MVLQKDHNTIPKAKDLILISPNYISSTFDCSSKHGWSSCWTLLALSQVIGIPIKSVYPPMNGQQDFSFKSLNFTTVPRFCQNNDKNTTIMWTRKGHHDQTKTWTPNHFVPLIIEPTKPQTVRSNSPVAISPVTITVIPPKQTKKEPVANETIEIDISHSTEPTEHVDPEVSTTCNSVDDSHVSPPSTYKIQNGVNLDAEGLLSTLLDHQLEIVETIPHGYKDNVFCLLDNSENILRKQNSQASYYADDCGSWDTHSARSMKTDFIFMPNGDLKWTVKKTIVIVLRLNQKAKRFTH
ncbi:unnamed protein product [Mytilus coruscus]|uniref:Uncharacterized protein n=1 Tax=Mytilus coruscus TaxID=42192 RepID=A0A6J7ZXL6_MYTCO|nr:unnamed protein product [Mytilus coruscus]